MDFNTCIVDECNVRIAANFNQAFWPRNNSGSAECSCTFNDCFFNDSFDFKIAFCRYTCPVFNIA